MNIVETELYRFKKAFCTYLHVGYIIPTNDGRWFAGSMQLVMN